MATTFTFRFAPLYRALALPWGITPGTAAVHLDTETLRIRFGPWVVRTARANVADTQITGPYNLFRTAGPAHLSLADRGLTLATNGDRGVCIQFFAPVPGIAPTGRLKHPAVTVTVEDMEALMLALKQVGT